MQVQGIINAYIYSNPDMPMQIMGLSFLGETATMTSNPFRCLFKGPYTVLAMITIFQPLLSPVISSLMILFRKLMLKIEHVKPERMRIISAKFKHAFIRGCVVYLFLIHKDIVFTVLRVFKTVNIQGKDYLANDLSIEANSKEYTILFVSAIIGFIFFAFGIPAVFLVVLYKGKRHINSDKMTIRYGFLYSGYDPKRYTYLWQIYEISKRIVLVMIEVFISDGYIQNRIAEIVMILALVIHYMVKPYKHRILNHAEGLSIFITILSLFVSDAYNHSGNNSWSILLIILNFGGIVLFALLALIYGVKSLMKMTKILPSDFRNMIVSENSMRSINSMATFHDSSVSYSIKSDLSPRTVEKKEVSSKTHKHDSFFSLSQNNHEKATSDKVTSGDKSSDKVTSSEKTISEKTITSEKLTSRVRNERLTSSGKSEKLTDKEKNEKITDRKNEKLENDSFVTPVLNMNDSTHIIPSPILKQSKIVKK